MDTSTTNNSPHKKLSSNKKQIKLSWKENKLFVPADQLTKLPKREDNEYLAGDLIWCKVGLIDT